VRRILAVLIATAATTTACGSDLRKFPLKEPMWRDPDRHAFEGMPEEYYSPFAWDAANQTIFRPISRFFAIDPAGEAVNVNAFDEVPDSSWFTNRIGRFPMTPEEASLGTCDTPVPDVTKPWKIKGAKPNGFNPGFFVKASDGKKYLMKFDGVSEAPRPTAADTICSRLFFAAGYYTACNRIIYFDRKILKIADDAESENEDGDKVKMTEKDIDTVLSKATRMTDGTYRASISRFLDGKPLGPWKYEGTRGDDPNDVVNHEDRRELRGMAVLAAWLGYTDSREQNTMASFIGDGKKGYVRHYMLDVGNSFGSVWEPPMLGRRIGHAYYLDVPYVLEDFVTLGTIQRPWDDLRFGPTGVVFGYYDVEHFDPDKFRSGYPNPAFLRKSERDSAWMARILAHYSDAHVRAIVDMADMQPKYRDRLLFLLHGRLQKILRRYLTRLSPLTWPTLRPEKRELCLEDLGLVSGIASKSTRRYTAKAWLGDDLSPATPRVRLDGGRYACAELPGVPGASKSDPRYLIVDITASDTQGPARVHLYHLGRNDYRVVGLQRPDDGDPPS
jgi:hypothetical protein